MYIYIYTYIKYSTFTPVIRCNSKKYITYKDILWRGHQQAPQELLNQTLKSLVSSTSLSEKHTVFFRLGFNKNRGYE